MPTQERLRKFAAGGAVAHTRKKKKDLRNSEISGKCLNFTEWYPSLLSPCQNENVVNPSKKNSWKIEIKISP